MKCRNFIAFFVGRGLFGAGWFAAGGFRFPVHAAGKVIGSQGTGDVVPYAEDGTGDSSGSTEVQYGKGRGKTGVLHADFNGDSLGLGDVHVKGLSDKETDAVAQQIMEHDHKHNQEPRFQDALGAYGHDTADNQYDSHNGNQRQELDDFLYGFFKETVDEDAEDNWQDDHLHDGQHHGGQGEGLGHGGAGAV